MVGRFEQDNDEMNANEGKSTEVIISFVGWSCVRFLLSTLECINERLTLVYPIKKEIK